MGDPCAKCPCGRAHHGRGRRRLSPTSRPLTVGAEEASFGRHPRRHHRPCHHLGRSRRRCRALRRVGRPFRPSTPSVKKHERVTAISWAHCGLRRSFLVLWTLHIYEKNHLWPFEARADFFSLSLLLLGWHPTVSTLSLSLSLLILLLGWHPTVSTR